MVRKFLAFLLAVVPLSSSVRGEFMLNALTGFGGSDGWLSPAESVSDGLATSTGALGTTNLQRGLAYYGPRNELYVMDRNNGNFVRVLDGSSGAVLRTLDTTGILTTGATFNSNMLGVGGDGAIYLANLATNAPQPFRMYRWADSTAGVAPAIAFNANIAGIATAGGRTGDAFAVFGSGASTRIVASGNASGLTTFDTTDGTNFTQTGANIVTGIPTSATRLAVEFINADTAIGKSTGTPFYSVALPAEGSASSAQPAGTTFNNTALLGGLQSGNENLLGYYGPNSLLATIETNLASPLAINTVRIYGASNLNSLSLFSTANLVNPIDAILNSNAVGDLTFGVSPTGDLRLYAMNTNNGIQAFSITAVPEPSSIALATLGVVGIVVRRRQLANRKQVS